MHGNLQDLFISLFITILYIGHLSWQQTRDNFVYVHWGNISHMMSLKIEKRNYRAFNKGENNWIKRFLKSITFSWINLVCCIVTWSRQFVSPYGLNTFAWLSQNDKMWYMKFWHNWHLFVIALFQSGTKKTLKPVVSEEIINDAKAKVSPKSRTTYLVTVPYDIQDSR